MWAYQLTAPRHFERVEVTAPEEKDLKDGQVLLRSLAGAVCGSDLGAFMGHHVPRPQFQGTYAPNFPGFPMHETLGEVVASRSPLFTAGMRVVGWAANNDAISEYLITGDDVVATYDTDLEPTTAILIQTLACVIYAVDQIGDVEGHHAAVLGQGPIGVLFSHVLKSRGAAKVTGIDLVDRSDVAGYFGVDDSIQGATERWASHVADADRPTVLVEAIGHQAFTIGDALNGIAIGGRLYYFGVPDVPPVSFDLHTFLRKQLTMMSGVTLSRRQYLEIAREYLKSHPVLTEQYVTHVFDVPDVEQAFQAACAPARGQLKVAVRMA